MCRLTFLPGTQLALEIQVFAQIFQDGGEEVLDHFELFESHLFIR